MHKCGSFLAALVIGRGANFDREDIEATSTKKVSDRVAHYGNEMSTALTEQDMQV